MNDWKPDRSGQFLTVVYKDVVPGDEVGALHEHPKCVAISWSNALHDVDYLRNRLPIQQKPLTEEQRREIAARWRDGNGTASEIIDMVEAAHNIKE
jgi:hypothetical protein